MRTPEPVRAAGAVVWREGARGVEVVLIHRPKYDDWSFPKGKLDPGEHALSAAVREVAEETGLTVHLGVPLGSQAYHVDGTAKQVEYWAARPGDGRETFRPDHEVDDLAWLPVDAARSRLTHAHDGQILDRFACSAHRSSPLLVLRHAQALPRDRWRADDLARPLSDLGEHQARALIPLLQAYGVQRVLTSDATRCLDTVRPFAAHARIELESDHRYSEEGLDLDRLRRTVSDVLADDAPTLWCSHRRVLPDLLAALGLDDPGLEPAELVVAHRAEGRVLATEQHTT